ncbi:MAG: alpha/beta hydrolase [Sphingomonas sp.]|nr:alpha/beta hydrolase [Sphingomonas sp.]
MSYVTTNDGTRIFYKDWGSKDAQPIVFSHGWPLSADAWDGQMLFMLQQGYRVIAHDRRGHGRSDQPDTGNDMDTYADDLAAVIEALDLRNVVLVGHSTGGGEIAHYVGRHGTSRVAKMVLVGAVPPRMAVSDIYPNGLPLDVFDGIRKGVADNRSQFYLDLSTPFFGFNREGASVSEGLRQSFWRQGMQGSIIGQYLCVHEFSEVDYAPDLRAIDVPTLFIHGNDDQIVPIGNAAELAVTMVPGSTLTVYEGAPHGLTATHQDRFNADLLAFVKG